MYSSFQLYYVPPHDPDTIYIEPDVTQLQAVEIVEHEFRREVSGFDEAYLHFQYYNYSQELRNQEDYQQYLRSIRPGWSLSHVKEKPELLDLPLIFVHANGTHYRIDSDDQEFEKTCEEPSANCTLGSRGGEVAIVEDFS